MTGAPEKNSSEDVAIYVCKILKIRVPIGGFHSDAMEEPFFRTFQ